jgi:N-acyl-D-aspartate/D-glutamate deacylase
VGLAKTGVIRPGYRADLLVLEMNPLKDFEVLYGTGVKRVSPDGRVARRNGLEYTIVDGRVFDARSVLAEVASMVERAKVAGREFGKAALRQGRLRNPQVAPV